MACISLVPESLFTRPTTFALAVGEVASRRALVGFPGLRARIGRFARTTPPDDGGRARTLADLADALRELGVRTGIALMVHSGWDALQRFGAKPTEVIALLRDLAGAGGTLLMPTHPMPRVRDGLPIYDVERSPSSVGLLTEALRRTPGAVRSPMPEAPVAAVGMDALAYTADFRSLSNGTPYGRGSPWERLAAARVQVLFLGIPFMRANTLQHAAFDVLADENPIAGFWMAKRWRVIRHGVEEEWIVRRQRPDLEQFLATTAFDRLVRRERFLRWRTIGGVGLGVLDAHDFLQWHLDVARRTGLPFWGWPGSLRASVRRAAA